MASLIKTAAVAVAMRKCPFLSNEVLSFALKSRSLSMFAKKCPVMSKLMTQGVVTLPATYDLKGENEAVPEEELKLPTLTKLEAPTQKNEAQPLPPKYDSILNDNIEAKKRDSTYRTFQVLSRTAEKKPYAMARTTPLQLEDEDVSVWCSNDYLGMSSHPKVTGAVIDTINRHGVGAGGTRSIGGTSHYHVELEDTLADLHGKDSALLFSSCYVANDTTLQTLGRVLNAEIYSDQGNHASMIAGINNSRMPKFVFRHNDLDHLEELLVKGDPDRMKIVAFESVYSMTGTIAPIEELCDLAHKYNALTFVDEVHAVGLYGYHGAGLAEERGMAHKIDIVSGTLGKAYGLVGGYIASTGPLIDVVRSLGSGLIFTTSIPPSTAAGAVTSINILAQQEGRELRLRHRAAYNILRVKLLKAGFPVLDCPSHIVPLHIGDALKATLCMDTLLEKHKLYVQAINYPTVPRGRELLRFVATPYHTPRMMDYLISALDDVWSNLDLPKCENFSLKN
ncbi:5-aminolevulinate synthase, non-specific, mitochondrial-like [Bolinopsis microptera]|uniref:5-aminolevulinate synthase, non-specific, mitochondrial-like n=1 Tax=Bolinopsis microptera TaxID=2820187 RepID=UPI00307AC3D7